MTRLDRDEVARKITEISQSHANGYRREGDEAGEQAACAASNTGFFILHGLGFTTDEIKLWRDRYHERKTD